MRTKLSRFLGAIFAVALATNGKADTSAYLWPNADITVPPPSDVTPMPPSSRFDLLNDAGIDTTYVATTASGGQFTVKYGTPNPNGTHTTQVDVEFRARMIGSGTATVAIELRDSSTPGGAILRWGSKPLAGSQWADYSIPFPVQIGSGARLRTRFTMTYGGGVTSVRIAEAKIKTTSSSPSGSCASTANGVCNGLVAWWKMDEGDADGSTEVARADSTDCSTQLFDLVNDVSQGTDPTYVRSTSDVRDYPANNMGSGNAVYKTQPGPSFPDYSHLGTGGSPPNLQVFDNNKSFTIAGWYKLITTDNGGHEFEKGNNVEEGGNPSPLREWAVSYKDDPPDNDTFGHMEFIVYDNDIPQPDSNYAQRVEIPQHSPGHAECLSTDPLCWDPVAHQGEWFFVAARFDGSMPSAQVMYLQVRDGTKVVNATKTITVTNWKIRNTASSVRQGGSEGYSGNPVDEPQDRQFDDFMIWNRRLSDDELTEVYTNGLHGDTLGCDDAP